MSSFLKLPGLGENVETGVVVKIQVARGDKVQIDQNLLEIETGKSVLELPSPFEGTVEEILVAEGDEVSVGQDLMHIAEEKAGTTVSTPEKTTDTSPPPPPATPSKTTTPPPSAGETIPSPPQPETTGTSRRMIPAAPSVRKFARELGLNLEDIPGTGAHGRISIADVKAYARYLNQPRTSDEPAISPQGEVLPPLPNFAAWGEISRESMGQVRLQTARQVSRCWSQIPMVTQFAQADITKLEMLRQRFADRAATAGGKLTMAVMTVKIVASALKIFPQFNAAVDMQKKEIIYRKYFNIGIAVSTSRGLFVPVLKKVDRKNMVDIAVEVSQMAQKARDGKLTPQDMEGGCFTVTNLGNIGGTHFTPIVNYPEAAILGMGRAYTAAGYIDGAWQPQTVLPLSLSYDHRLIDGADGARFLKWICEAIEEPLILSLEG